MLFKTSGVLGVYADAWTKVEFLRPDVDTFLEVYSVLALTETWQMIFRISGMRVCCHCRLQSWQL